MTGHENIIKSVTSCLPQFSSNLQYNRTVDLKFQINTFSAHDENHVSLISL